ncbi:hypothetical protein ACLRAA_08230, partial [Gallibacterium anatis]
LFRHFCIGNFFLYVLNNPENIDKSKIEKLELVKGLFSITNQYQIIFGKDLVDIVYRKMQEQL